MTVEQKCGVFDECSVGMVRKIGQPDNRETGLSESIFVRDVLHRGLCCIDRHAVQMRQLAVG
jgi:hypothetical protein